MILTKVREYKDRKLDPDPNLTFMIILEKILKKSNPLRKQKISGVDYENALSISSDDGYEIHLERSPNFCFVKNFFKFGILVWETNMNIKSDFL